MESKVRRLLKVGFLALYMSSQAAIGAVITLPVSGPTLVGVATLAGTALVSSACEEAGDADGDGTPGTNHDVEVACSPGGKWYPCTTGGGGCVDCTENPDVEDP